MPGHHPDSVDDRDPPMRATQMRDERRWDRHSSRIATARQLRRATAGVRTSLPATRRATSPAHRRRAGSRTLSARGAGPIRVGTSAWGAPVVRNCCFAQGRIRGRIARVDDWLVHSMRPGPTELAVENERLQRALRARLEEEQALRRVATLVARQHAPEAALALVTEEVARHLHASAASTVRYDDPDHATVVATWTAPGVASFTLGRQIEIVAGTPLAPAQRPRAPARGGSPATGERGGAPGMAA